MKKSFVLIVAFLLAHFASTAQPGNMSSVSTNMYKAILTKWGYTICADQHCTMSQGNTCYYYKTFYEGQTYRLLAFSEDEDVTDVDIWLYELDGSINDQDVSGDDAGELTFTPAVTRQMKVVFGNQASRTPNYESLCKLIIGYQSVE